MQTGQQKAAASDLSAAVDWHRVATNAPPSGRSILNGSTTAARAMGYQSFGEALAASTPRGLALLARAPLARQQRNGPASAPAIAAPATTAGTAAGHGSVPVVELGRQEERTEDGAMSTRDTGMGGGVSIESILLSRQDGADERIDGAYDLIRAGQAWADEQHQHIYAEMADMKAMLATHESRLVRQEGTWKGILPWLSLGASVLMGCAAIATTLLLASIGSLWFLATHLPH